MSESGKQLQTTQQTTQPAVADPLVDANRNLAEALKGPLALPTDSVVLAPDVPATWFAPPLEPFLPPDVKRPSLSMNDVRPGSNSHVSAADTKEIKAVFTEPMNRATLTTSTFTLTKIEGATETQVTAAEVRYDPKTKTATLHLKDSLKALSAPNKYKATVKGGHDGVKDLAGNLLSPPEGVPGDVPVEVNTAGDTVTISWYFFTDR